MPDLLAGDFFDGIFLKEHLKAFMIEGKSDSIIQIDPSVDRHNYYVVGKAKGVDGLNRCMRVNKSETCLLVNDGRQIQVWEIAPEGQKGIRHSGLNIVIQNSGSAVIEDFATIKNKGVITCDSTGLIEVFMYDMQKKTSKKVSDFFINSGVTEPNLIEQITTIGMDE